MNKQILKYVSFGSLIFIGLLGILNIWGIIAWNELVAKIMITVGIIFVVSALIYEILQKDTKK